MANRFNVVHFGPAAMEYVRSSGSSRLLRTSSHRRQAGPRSLLIATHAQAYRLGPLLPVAIVIVSQARFDRAFARFCPVNRKP